MTTSIHKCYGTNCRQISPAVVNLFQNNNAVDSIEFQIENYVQDNVNLSTLDPYVICHGNEFVGGLDEVKLTSEVTVDGTLRVYWDLTLMTLSSPQTISAQLVFKNDAGAVWTSYKIILFCNESLTADEEIVAQYPTILKQMETRIDTKTNEATQGAVEEIKDVVSDGVADALEQVNQMAQAFDAAVVYIPYGENIPVEERINNRLYYQYTNGEHTQGRFEDYMGNVLIAEGSGGGGGGSSLPMFAPIWADHLYNDASYLRADTFSWHDGRIYVTGYETLLKEYNNENCVEETENGVTYRRSPNGYKIANADQHDNVRYAYETYGISWFYILDTENGRFKLPRTEYGFTGVRDNVGGDVEAGLPSIEHTHTRGTMNITGETSVARFSGGVDEGALSVTTSLYNVGSTTGSSLGANTIELDASQSWIGETSGNSRVNDIYGNSNTVQPPATQMYLYFYVGQYEREEGEVNIGAMTEVVNDLQAQVVSLNGEMTSLNEEVSSLKAEINTMLGRMDFANAETFTVKQGTSYTCLSDGYVQFDYVSKAETIYHVLINDIYYCSYSAINSGAVGIIPVSNGDIISANDAERATATFIPQKGV